MKGPRPHYSPSDEQRAAVSKAHTGKVLSTSTKAKISSPARRPR
jgi:hypothetical protein